MLQKKWRVVSGKAFPFIRKNRHIISSVKTAFSQKSPYIVRLTGLSATAGMILGSGFSASTALIIAAISSLRCLDCGKPI